MTKRMPFPVLEEATSLHQAARGDLSVLIARLREGAHLGQAEAELVADILEGKRALPAHRVRRLAMDLRDRDLVELLLVRELIEPKRPKLLEVVADENGVSRSTLYDALKRVESHPEGLASARKRAQRLYKNFKDAWDRIGPDDEIDEASEHGPSS